MKTLLCAVLIVLILMSTRIEGRGGARILRRHPDVMYTDVSLITYE